MKGTVSEEKLASVQSAIIELAQLSLAFGRVERQTAHADGRPESDTDHTVMLGWIAPALAELVNVAHGFQRYNVGLIAQYALIHDMPEVYAGDTPTIRLTETEAMVKEEKEAVAAAKLRAQFRNRLPWVARMVREYESQWRQEAKFVRAVDKLLPKIVYLVDNGASLRRGNVTKEEFSLMVAKQRPLMLRWINDKLVMGLYDQLCAKVLLEWPETTSAAPQQPGPPVHKLRVVGRQISMIHLGCLHPEDGLTCPYTVAYSQAVKGSGFNEEIDNWGLLMQGDYTVQLDERGELKFAD